MARCQLCGYNTTDLVDCVIVEYDSCKNVKGKKLVRICDDCYGDDYILKDNVVYKKMYVIEE